MSGDRVSGKSGKGEGRFLDASCKSRKRSRERRPEMILAGFALCVGRNVTLFQLPHEAHGVCNICGRAFCKACTLNFAILDEEIRRKLNFLLLGSLPHMICSGCGWAMTMFYGNRLEGILPDTDVVGELTPVLNELKRLDLYPERVEDYFGVLAVMRRTGTGQATK